jgi:hypothetical protein
MQWLRYGCLSLAISSLVTGCDALREILADEGPPLDEPPREPAKPKLRPVPPRPSGSASPGSRAVASALIEVRNQRLKLAPRSTPGQKLAFGPALLGQLGERELVVRKLSDFSVVLRRPLPDAHALVELLDGSLLALGRDRNLLLPLGGGKPVELAPLGLSPGLSVLADRREARRLWLLHWFVGSLYRYDQDAVDAGPLGMGAFYPLEDFDRRAFALLKDGSFIYSTRDGLRRFYSPAKKSVLKDPTDGSEGLRIFSARRSDQIFVVTERGELLLAQLADRLNVLQKLTLPPGIYDIDINDDSIALVRAEEVPDAARRWELVVYDARGERKFSAELPSDPASADEDWMTSVTRNKQVVLSRRKPLVAVGGPTWLGVWNTVSGERVPLP